MKVRAVLFDLDGVLIDSYAAWFAVVDETARAFGLPAISAERFKSVWGQGISADVKNLYPGRTHREVEAAYEAAMPRHASLVRVNPEGAAALDDLAARNVARAVITNTQTSVARALLSGARLLDRFDRVEGMAEGRREKPAPDLLLAALRAFRVEAAETLMVGDSRYDEEAAAAAGVPFLRYDLRTGASLTSALRERLS